MSDTASSLREAELRMLGRRFNEAVEMLSRVLAHAKLGLLASEVERVLARCRALQALRQLPGAAATVPACPGTCCDCGRGCAVAPTAAAEALTRTQDVVPGRMRCAKCQFELTRVTLCVSTGEAGAGGNETEPCPNGCGPLWPVTWEQEARSCWKTSEALFDRAKAAEDALEALRAPGLRAVGPTTSDATDAELRADAERYRALRVRTLGGVPLVRVQLMVRGQYLLKKGDEIDQVIDALHNTGATAAATSVSEPPYQNEASDGHS